MYNLVIKTNSRELARVTNITSYVDGKNEFNRHAHKLLIIATISEEDKLEDDTFQEVTMCLFKDGGYFQSLMLMESYLLRDDILDKYVLTSC